MATFENNTVTIEGRKLLVDSLVNGVSIEFTAFGIGDGATPDTPENLTELVNKLFEVSVSKTQADNKEKGITLVRGSFKNTAENGDFYWRELGLYARRAGTEETPVLFGYINMGETADYIPSVGIGSVITQGILLQVVTGSATVLYVTDPTAAATLQDIDDCIAEVEARLAAFTAEHLATIEQQVKTLQDSISKAITDLNNASAGYVKKAGDTMTGDLTMGQDAAGNNCKVIGDLEGSASMWAGWQIFNSVEEYNNLTNSDIDIRNIDMATLCGELPSKCRLIAAIDSVTNSNLPAVTGILEIQKVDYDSIRLCYSSGDGMAWRGAIGGYGFSGWISTLGALPGTISMYAGQTAPLGWLLCWGQSVPIASYPALYEVIGNSFGDAGTTGNFALPDFRGVFPRGYDAGRGIDINRKWGTAQDCAAPNITGVGPRFSKEIWNGLGTSGAIYFDGTETESRGENGDGGKSGKNGWNLDASRSSSVYKNGVHEIRPKNLAVSFIIKY